MLSGCFLDGDNGSVGRAGETGAAGRAGETGAAGISCWDLNENGVKDSPDEDSNRDSFVNVLDCRAIPSSPVTTTVVGNPTTGLVVNTHSREGNASFLFGAERIDLYSGTSSDYLSAVTGGNYASLDVFLNDLSTEDSCGIWSWTNDSGNYQLTANNVVSYSTSHHPVSAIDSDGNNHYGNEACLLSCKSDAQCVAAFYNVENTIGSNTMICTLGYQVDIELATNSEMLAMEGFFPGLMVANIEGEAGLLSGIISVCDTP